MHESAMDPPRKIVAADVLSKASEPARVFEEQPHTLVTVTEEEQHRIHTEME